MIGLLLVNLGSPAEPTRKGVARFLDEFLSDPRVVDLPRWLWLPLLKGVIVPLRSGRSAEAYRKIWTPAGSPLLLNSRALAERLADRMTCRVRLAMRYGSPGISEGLSALRAEGVSQLVVLPLYPQFSGTTTASVFDGVDAALKALDWWPQRRDIRDYHVDAGWVQAVAGSIRRHREQHGIADRLVFSLHGIPQRYVRQGDPYEDQCRAGVAAIAAEAGLGKDEYLLTYQSRVGREPWLQPYTDETLSELAEAGVRRVQLVCPGFAVDCLETLEEIDMQNRELFLEAGGERFEYIPCLNADPAHVEALAGLAERIDWSH